MFGAWLGGTCALALAFSQVAAAPASAWKDRRLYQLITDRFSRATNKLNTLQPDCSDLTGYCGGSFEGIENNLDYIQAMGFDAIWISPVVENSYRGYHGDLHRYR